MRCGAIAETSAQCIDEPHAEAVVSESHLHIEQRPMRSLSLHKADGAAGMRASEIYLVTADCLQDTVSTMAKDIAKSSNIDATQASAQELYQFMKRVSNSSLNPAIPALAACAILCSCLMHLGTPNITCLAAPLRSIQGIIAAL